MNILIADDMELQRIWLGYSIAEEFPLAVISKAENGTQAEKMTREGKLDLLVLDISMPDKTGLDVIKQLRSESIKIPILVVSSHSEDQYALRSFRAGADGYISKDCSHPDFINAIKTVLSGKKYISSNLSEMMATRMGKGKDEEKEMHENISDRELQILILISTGKTVSQIASQLSLSISTISTYRTRLLEKMMLKNTAALINYVIQHKLA